MKTTDPNQLNVFWDNYPVVTPAPTPIESHIRVRDKLDAAAMQNKSLIRLQPGYGGGQWIIKKQSKGDSAVGWTYLAKYDIEKEAKDAYAALLASGEYVEG